MGFGTSWTAPFSARGAAGVHLFSEARSNSLSLVKHFRYVKRARSAPVADAPALRRFEYRHFANQRKVWAQAESDGHPEYLLTHGVPWSPRFASGAVPPRRIFWPFAWGRTSG